jgi:hypothetical protein
MTLIIPLQLGPQLLIACLPLFEEYHANLKRKTNRSQEETSVMASVAVLMEYLHRDYRSTIASIVRLTSHHEITFDLLYAILVPRSILVTTCRVTGEPLALQLIHARQVGCFGYELICESVDVDDQPHSDSQLSNDEELREVGDGCTFGRVTSRVMIGAFSGTLKINELDCYPIKYATNESELRASLVARGRKWASYNGVHHLSYQGTAALRVAGPRGSKAVIRYSVRFICGITML